MSPSTPDLNEHLKKRVKKFEEFPETFRATVALELRTPLHIGSGSETGSADAGVVFDANGLATIPGSSLKGVLRAAYRAATMLGDDAPELTRYFGFQRGDQGQGARIRVSWGRVHDQRNQPVEGLIDPALFRTDPVLASAASPELRDHARIDHRGIAENKFDEVSIVAGHRFTFRLEMDARGDDPDDLAAWSTLLAILRRGEGEAGDFRLGGKTRRGFGLAQVIALDASPDDSTVSLPARLQTLCDLTLVPDGDCFWMFGEGADLGEQGSADSAPVRASRIKWGGSPLGTVQNNLLLVPGSGVKGPLRHRTRFHLCRQFGVWAENPDPEKQEQVEHALHLLFGNVELDPAKKPASGRIATSDVACVGRVYIDDLYLADQGDDLRAGTVRDQQNHVTIDRALGGAQDHHLFSDRPLHGGGFRLLIRWLPPNQDLPDGDRMLIEEAVKALAAAVADLGDGRLALGAHGNRGYGWFRDRDQTRSA